MLQLVLEPIVIVFKTNQHGGRSAVTSHDNFFARRQINVPREVVLHL